ncbi:uncharacterized protein LOC118414023 isoform X1 [Branchiostoma floridae]|uniref:Uncharacterized protein LOC118414023 isoform X1 n=1 Tax=Branchiostoma floridae TaxID=7739 RepID=A0A9J7L031_BRAFL|nr:uncharacterized protein LOC118414023 isoform X1 [Branchiostoma floridae]
MDPQHLRALRDHRVQLVHGTKHIPTILDYLVQDNIITEEDEQQVQEKDGPNQIRKLLAILPSKGDRAFQSFCQALGRTGHSGLARRLNTCSNDVDRTGQNVIFDPGSSQHSRLHDQNSNAVSSCAHDLQTVNKPTRKKVSGEHVFIVHAGEDKDSFVRPLVQTLQDKGIAQEDIFYDELSISTGEVIRDRIMSALASDSMEVVVIVASKSLLNHKYWPKLELETALRHNKRLYPIWLDDNLDSFKEFSSLVGQYCPTLKQIRAHCVLTSKISEEMAVIASELMSMISCSIVQENGHKSKDSHTGNAGSSMTSNFSRFVAELPDMTQGFTQSGPTTSPCQLSSESSSTILSGTVESMGYDQFDASQTTATSAVSSGMNSVGQEFITQAGPSTSPLQGCNGQSSVQSRHIKSPFMLEDASEDEKFMKKMHSGVRSAHSISGNQHQLHGAGKRQSTSRKPDSPYMSPSRLLDIDLEAAMEVVVASIISDEWRTLLHHLGLSELELETLQNKETPEAACEAGLKLWRETRGQEVTTERLVRAVKDTKVKLRNGADVKIKLSIKEKWTDWLNKKADIIFTEEVLNDPQRFDSAMLRFDKLKGSIKDLWEGSVWCLLTFYRWSSVQEFVGGCREGALTELLTEDYVDEQMMAACGGTELYVCVEIDQTDLHKAWNFFHADCNSPDEDHPPSGDWQAETISALSSSSSPDGEPMDIDTHISVKEEPMDFESDLDTAFEIVSKDLWSDWERLARTMGFTQSDVDSIKSGSPDQPYEQCWQLLYRWRDREGQRATLQALMQQLRVAGFHETSEKLDIGDMSDQEEHGASKKSWDDSESSSDSDSDSDGDDNSMKGAVSIRSKMKQLKKGKRQVPDPQWSTVKGVKRKKMEDDGDVEMHMVKQTGVTTSDSTVPAEEATDDLSFMLTPADIKCWQDAMKTHVLSTSRVSLEEQFRFNMLVMHLIKDEYYHKHLCCYWNDKGSLPVRLTQFVSYVVTKCGHEHCIKGNLDKEVYDGMEQDIQYQLGKLLFKQDAAGVCKQLSRDSLQSCFTNDQLKYVQAWLEPTSDSGSSVAPYYRFKHECVRQYIMAVWVAGTIYEQGETIRANDFLRQCFDISSKLDTMAYLVAGHMAQNDQVELFSYQLSRILFSMDTTDFSVIQKVAICVAETGQVDRFESHTSQIFPGNVIDLTSWPSMSYLGKLSLAHLKETFPLTCKLSHEDDILKLLFKSKQNKAEAQLVLSLMKSRHRSVVLYPHYKSLLEGSTALVSQTPCRIDKLYLNNLALADPDFSNILPLLQFVPGLKHLSLQKTKLSIFGMSKICDFLSFIPNIEHLVLFKCRIPKDSFLTLTEHLQCLKKLKHLNLSQTVLTNEGVNLFAHNLSSLKAIEVLDLRKTKVGKDEVANLCESIANMDNIPQLILGSQTSSYRFFLGITNSRGSRLIIQTSDLNIVSLVSKLSSQVYRVQLSHQGKVLYSVQAKEGENKDMTFDLTCSGNITENIHALSLVLPVGHRVQQADVEQLELGVCLIGDEEVALLAEMFCYLPCLKHLDLSNNMITSSGALAVAAHISHLQQLEWLDLSGNNIGEVGVTAMNEKLVNLEKLKYVNFNMNSVTVNMRTCLLLTLSNMENLSEVNLSTERSFYLYLLGVYNNKGNRLTIRTGDADVVSLVDQVFSQVYRVELSWRGKVLYSVQADGGLRGEPTQDDIRSDMCW